MFEKKEKRIVYTFGLASFLNDMGSDIIKPIFPLFVVKVLGASMTFLGFLDGLGDMVVSLANLFSGYLSDKIERRKPFIWVGYFFGAISRFGYAIATIPAHLIPPKVLDRMGKIRGAPRDALIADKTPPQKHGRAFGILRMLDHLGAFTGTLIVIGLINRLDMRYIFLLAVIPTLISVLLIQLLIPPDRGKIRKNLPILRGLGGPVYLLVSLTTISTLGFFSYSFLLIYSYSMGFSFITVTALYLLFSGVSSLFSYVSGRLIDSIGDIQILCVSYLLFAVMCLLCILGVGNWNILWIFIIYGLHTASFEPAIRTVASDVAPPDRRGSVLGLIHMVGGITALPASLIAGFLWDRFGYSAPFKFSLVLMITSLLVSVLLLFYRRKQRTT